MKTREDKRMAKLIIIIISSSISIIISKLWFLDIFWKY